MEGSRLHWSSFWVGVIVAYLALPYLLGAWEMVTKWHR